MKSSSTAHLKPREAALEWDLPEVVDALTVANRDVLPNRHRRLDRLIMPSRSALEDFVTELRSILFPVHFGPPDLSESAIRFLISHRLNVVLPDLQEQVRRGLLFTCTHGVADCTDCSKRAAEVTRAFALRLPAIRTLLGADARAAYECDPAATSPDEAIFCYPGVTAITHHRIAHEIYVHDVPLIPRVIAEIAHSLTGIDIHPGAEIGSSFFIDHGTGVVIGETSVIGDRVRLYQGVTLGAKSFPTDDQGRSIKGVLRHPIVEDDVTIYAGATILGSIRIGRGSSIGGNVWLTRGVPPGSRISQAHPRDDIFDGGAGI